MSRYVLTPPARDDLREIREYIRLDNPDAALRVVDDLRRRCRALARRPYIGHTRTDLLPEEFRIFPVGSYLIVYRPETKPLQIIRFWHAARGTPDLF
jgi:plasmid stabilization system protein ParE